MTKYMLDRIKPGSIVTLHLHGYDKEESVIFLGIEGKGDDRRAKFCQATNYLLNEETCVRIFTWYAYRYNRRWAYGSGADRLSLVDVIA